MHTPPKITVPIETGGPAAQAGLALIEAVHEDMPVEVHPSAMLAAAMTHARNAFASHVGRYAPNVYLIAIATVAAAEIRAQAALLCAETGLPADYAALGRGTIAANFVEQLGACLSVTPDRPTEARAPAPRKAAS
jgi:hypothetical protein